MCQITNVADTNLDGCVQLNDLLDLLIAYGNCAADESVWQWVNSLNTMATTGCTDWRAVLVAENLKKLDAVYPGTSQSYDDPRSYVYGYNGEMSMKPCSRPTMMSLVFCITMPQFKAKTCPAGWTPGTGRLEQPRSGPGGRLDRSLHLHLLRWCRVQRRCRTAHER